MFDRESGLNILLDEVTPPPQAWARAPRYVSIALTNACELRCPFCYAPKTPGRLAPDEVVAWIGELDRAGCLGVGFGGGEPTAHPHFAEICARAAASTSLAVTLTTHGHRFTDALANKLRGNVHFVRVSIDAVGQHYERIRGRRFDALRDSLPLSPDSRASASTWL
jgi:MoaA/NifB/PqqE/SkfB family radical SAM enzyme